MAEILYDNPERRLIAEAKEVANTMAEILIVEEFADDLQEAVALNMDFAASIARNQLKEFIKKRTP